MFSRYNKIFMATIGLAIALCGAMNAVVDPYGLWRLGEIRRFNAAKVEQVNHEFLFKAVDLERMSPQVLFIGSSRVLVGLDPRLPVWGPDSSAYNLGLTGGHLPTLLGYLEHALYNNSRVHTVVIGVDFFMFSQSMIAPEGFRADRLMRTSVPLFDLRDTLLSADALKASLTTIKSNYSQPDFMPYDAWGAATAVHLARISARDGMQKRFAESIDLYANDPQRFKGFRFSEARMEDFKAMLRLCRNKGLAVHVFLPPEHAILLQIMFGRGLWPEYEHWLRLMAEITSYWDFGGYNSVTTEPVAWTMQYYWDISHYRKNVGDMVLSRITGYDQLQVPPDFGTFVTRDSVERLIDLQRAQHQQWATAHPDLVAWVDKAAR